MQRTGHSPRVLIDHPRQGSGQSSSATLWAILDGKRDDTVSIPMTEDQLYDLADEALKIAAVLRRQRTQSGPAHT